MKSDKYKVLSRLLLLLLICELFSTPCFESSGLLIRHKIVHAHQKNRIPLFAFVSERDELDDENNDHKRHCTFLIMDLQAVAELLKEVHAGLSTLIPPIKRQGLHLPLFKFNQVFII